MEKYNDIDLKKWKEYKDVYTDSLWLIDRRDRSGVHNINYHGNFIPQIPYQLLTRYTKKGDWVLDPFMGSGTTLIEAQRMGRNAIGVEIQKNVADEARQRIEREKNGEIKAIVLNGDSKNINIGEELKKENISNVQFVIYHPPYWDIIKFSNEKEDLSNASTLEEFKTGFESVIDNTISCLEDGRYCGLVIGDKYANSQIIPLGFICMHMFIEKGLVLKAIIVKNLGETEAKGINESIWRYRAMAADYYVFKHEYIMIFKKPKKKIKTPNRSIVQENNKAMS